MRILLSIQSYKPYHNCGGEQMIHNMATWLVSRGHQVRVLMYLSNKFNIRTPYTFQGVQVFPGVGNIEGHFRWSDVVITHLEYTKASINWAKVFKRPIYFVVHNTNILNNLDSCVRTNKVNVIYNSAEAKEILNYPQRSIILPPPIDYRKYENENPHPAGQITLVNLNENKGVHTFTNIAANMEDKRFLGVLGGYGEQITPLMKNVQYVPNSADVTHVLRQTRILLMPSDYESWGMIGTEAMACGIPVIASPTFGLKQNLGEAGIYVDRNNVQGWIEEIKRLDDKKVYLSQSKKVRLRARELDPLPGLERFEKFLINPNEGDAC